MNGPSIPLNELVHEKLSIVMCYAYSRAPLEKMLKTNFKGDWRSLEKSLLEISRRRAEEACLSLAIFLRAFDEHEKLIKSMERAEANPGCGLVYMRSGSTKVLDARAAANKIIHAASFEWKISINPPEPPPPVDLICHAHADESRDWTHARILLIPFSAVCGLINH